VSGSTFGRERELETVRRTIADTARGAGGCLVLNGVAGVGKSHLIRAAIEMAGAHGLAVAAREAFRSDLNAPLVTLAGALRDCRPPTPAFGWLAETSDNAYVTLERLRESLENFAAHRPLVIVIDDAHWMDELSALAVRELVPALASSPVRWIFARRTPTADTAGQQALDWLSRGPAEQIHLDILDDAAVDLLCAEVVGAEVDNTVLALVGSCAGNPLQVENLLTALRMGDQLVVRDGVATVVGTELPASFITTVQELLKLLSGDARRLVQNGSLFGRPFSVDAVAHLMDRPPAALIPLIEEATGAKILSEDGDSLTFLHDLVRQAVYGTLPGPVKAILHRAAAAITRAEGAPAVEVAEHLLRSGRTGTAEAVAMLHDTARQVADVAPATAADLILHALRALGEHDPGRTPLIADAVRLLASAARVTEARELGEAALRAGLAADTEAALLLGLAEAFKHAGLNETAVRYADRGLRLDGLPEGTAARLHAIRAHALFYVGDLSGADVSGAAAETKGEASGERGASVFGLTARSLVAQAEGRLGDAYDHAWTATRIADRVGGEPAQRHPRIWLGNALATLDRFDEAEEAFERGRQESKRLGTAWSWPLWQYYYTALLTARGRLDEAVAEAEAGVSLAGQLTAYQLAVPLLGSLARLAVLRDEIGPAEESLSRMRHMMGTGITAPPEDVTWPEAVFLGATAGPEAAFGLLTDLYDALPGRPALIGQDPSSAAPLVTMAVAAGDRHRAELVVEAARRLAGRNPGSHSAAAAAAHADGLLRGDPVQLRRAVEEFRLTPRRLALAGALEDAAVAGRASDRATAEAWAEEALAIVTACGARRTRLRLEDRLREWRGAVVRPVEVVPAPCLPALTDGQRKVALLVGEGLTNIEVARALHLSPHTVDTHLRNIFQRLEISRRAALATIVARECGPHGLST
jgi:DNA-binding CsgD family transcriptional regulator/tetratricopeptide (TPR) repeat protein